MALVKLMAETGATGLGFPTEYVVEKLVTDPVEVARVMDMVKRERMMDPFLVAEERMRQGV